MIKKPRKCVNLLGQCACADCRKKKCQFRFGQVKLGQLGQVRLGFFFLRQAQWAEQSCPINTIGALRLVAGTFCCASCACNQLIFEDFCVTPLLLTDLDIYIYICVMHEISKFIIGRYNQQLTQQRKFELLKLFDRKLFGSRKLSKLVHSLYLLIFLGKCLIYYCIQYSSS